MFHQMLETKVPSPNEDVILPNQWWWSPSNNEKQSWIQQLASIIFSLHSPPFFHHYMGRFCLVRPQCSYHWVFTVFSIIRGVVMIFHHNMVVPCFYHSVNHHFSFYWCRLYYPSLSRPYCNGSYCCCCCCTYWFVAWNLIMPSYGYGYHSSLLKI